MRIADILQAIERCQRYVHFLDAADSGFVDMAEDAIERNLRIIGEAANELPAVVRRTVVRWIQDYGRPVVVLILPFVFFSAVRSQPNSVATASVCATKASAST